MMAFVIIMPVIQFFLAGLLWIAIGAWICYKRNWYTDFYLNETDRDDFQSIHIAVAIMLMPFNLMWVFIAEFIINNWKNK